MRDAPRRAGRAVVGAQRCLARGALRAAAGGRPGIPRRAGPASARPCSRPTASRTSRSTCPASRRSSPGCARSRGRTGRGRAPLSARASPSRSPRRRDLRSEPFRSGLAERLRLSRPAQACASSPRSSGCRTRRQPPARWAVTPGVARNPHAMRGQPLAGAESERVRPPQGLHPIIGAHAPSTAPSLGLPGRGRVLREPRTRRPRTRPRYASRGQLGRSARLGDRLLVCGANRGRGEGTVDGGREARVSPSRLRTAAPPALREDARAHGQRPRGARPGGARVLGGRGGAAPRAEGPAHAAPVHPRRGRACGPRRSRAGVPGHRPVHAPREARGRVRQARGAHGALRDGRGAGAVPARRARRGRPHVGRSARCERDRGLGPARGARPVFHARTLAVPPRPGPVDGARGLRRAPGAHGTPFGLPCPCAGRHGEGRRARGLPVAGRARRAPASPHGQGGPRARRPGRRDGVPGQGLAPVGVRASPPAARRPRVGQARSGRSEGQGRASCTSPGTRLHTASRRRWTAMAPLLLPALLDGVLDALRERYGLPCLRFGRTRWGAWPGQKISFSRVPGAFG